MKTAAGTNPRRPVVGIFLDSQPAVDIHLPIHVRIDAGNVGGPSAGLAFALEVMEKLGRDVVHGHKIAATGEISLGRLRRPDRRDQAESDRCARSGCGRFPRAGWGERRSRPARTRAGSESSLCITFHRRCARWRHCLPRPAETPFSAGSKSPENASFSVLTSLFRGSPAVVSPSAPPFPPPRKDNHDPTGCSDLQRLLLPPSRSLRPVPRAALPHLPRGDGHIAAAAPAAARAAGVPHRQRGSLVPQLTLAA